jgi:hypothetical protein
MSTDQAKSAIDRLVGAVWEIEPSKTRIPTLGPDLAHGIALSDEQAAAQKKPRTTKRNAPETETSEH